MAKGSGKTIVMAMVIAWHILNKVAAGQDARFSRNVMIIAPGLTVKSRLAVLEPAGIGNYYEDFNIVPSALLDKLRRGKVRIANWHALAWDSDERIKKRRSVDKRGAKSAPRRQPSGSADWTGCSARLASSPVTTSLQPRLRRPARRAAARRCSAGSSATSD